MLEDGLQQVVGARGDEEGGQTSKEKFGVRMSKKEMGTECHGYI